MPRASYGPDKQAQAWKLVAALIQARGDSLATEITRDGVAITYRNWPGAGVPQLAVQATLKDLGPFCSLSIDQVRESLTAHLADYLKILEDRRQQKAGRNAGTWTFVLTLWSTDLAENRQQFEALWQAKKSGAQSLPQPKPQADLFERVRQRCCEKILQQHSTIQLLNQTEIGVDQLYVDVWLLNRSPRTFMVSQNKLLETFDLRNDRIGLGDRIKRNEGITVANNKAKLLILGKPGSGKTTFLKYLAVDCSQGKFHPHLIPVLIELRRIQTPGWQLLDAIAAVLELEDLQQTRALLEQGKLLILMDGLDEVPTRSLRHNVQEQVRQLAQEPKYSGDRFILTCRTQIMETIPQGFASVEVADFNDNQVEQFVKNWFRASGQSEAAVAEQWQGFATAIQNNSALKELTVTPVLLSLMCWVFQDSGELPTQSTDLYRKGTRLLLEKWNNRKQIPGWQVGEEAYRQLSIEQKEQLLMEIAARKFENPENFVLFEQAELTQQITQFLQLGNQRDGEAVLRAIEAQHGLLVERADELWSFSHLTLQEYFTAQWFVQHQDWQSLVHHFHQPHWREIVKLTVQELPDAGNLMRLAKDKIDLIMAGDEQLQQFLIWVNDNATSGDVAYKFVVVRRFPGKKIPIKPDG